MSKRGSRGAQRNPDRRAIPRDAIYADMCVIARELGVDVLDLSRSRYLQNGGRYDKNVIQMKGGWNALKGLFEKSFEEGNLAEIRDMANTRQELNRRNRELGDRDALIERLEKSVKHIPEIKVKPFKPRNSKTEIDRVVTFNNGDTHWGADLLAEKGTVEFGPLEEARTQASFIKNVIEYKSDHRDKTKLVWNIQGDMIENILHGHSGAAPLTEQWCRAVYYLSHSAGQLASNFREVQVNCQTGNHGRNLSLHPGRATAEKWNSLETMLYFAVKSATAHLPNVTWDIPKAPYSVYSIFDFNYLMAHGDGNFNPGNPGRSINAKEMKRKIHEWNSDISLGKKINVSQVGHVHTYTVIYLDDGTVMMTNGGATPANEFAQILGHRRNRLLQGIYEITPSFACGDMRAIDATDAHKDKSLDSIIPPWKGINV